jgi:hypothetical protein
LRRVVALRETTADLARVALAQGDLDQAAADAATIMDALRDADLAGAEEPIEVYLTCYHVLRASHNPRAEDALARGYALLRERAAQFAADDQRRSFLENIPAHRTLVRAWSTHGQACAADSVLSVLTPTLDAHLDNTCTPAASAPSQPSELRHECAAEGWARSPRHAASARPPPGVPRRGPGRAGCAAVSRR